MFAAAAARSLQYALRNQRLPDQVIYLEDDLIIGPVLDNASRQAWLEKEMGLETGTRRAGSAAAVLDASYAGDALPMAWMSPRDARSHAGFLWWLAELGDTPCKVIDVTRLRVQTGRRVGAPVTSPSALSPEDMEALVDKGRAVSSPV